MCQEAQRLDFDISSTKAVILPHAGHQFSGDVAATLFKNYKNNSIKRIVIFGTPHFYYEASQGPFMLSPFQAVRLGHESSMMIDETAVSNLLETYPELFTLLDEHSDTNEHSIEMILSFLPHSFNVNECKILPIYVSNTANVSEECGEALKEFIEDPHTFFIISSDFCHYGKSYRYEPFTSKEHSDLSKEIEKLDMSGIDLIVDKKNEEFRKYLKESKNTICGRHGIALWLDLIRYLDIAEEFETKLLKYDQSYKIALRKWGERDRKFLSVSYAAIAFMHNSGH
ncbi:MAG: hypothetical protein MHMPM18_002385 [Marteilia pararefringens]